MESEGNGYATPDSGMFSENSSRRSSVSQSNDMSIGQPPMGYMGLSQADSGISTPSNPHGTNSTSGLDPSKLRSALEDLQVKVTGPGDKTVPLTINAGDTVDKLIRHATRVCGLGVDNDAYLRDGTQTLNLGSKLTVQQAGIKNGSQLQLIRRCTGG